MLAVLLVAGGSAHPRSRRGPEFGTISTVSGTGAAAKWRISRNFTLNDITGMSVEQLAVGGKVQASLASARGMTSVRKSVAKLLK